MRGSSASPPFDSRSSASSSRRSAWRSAASRTSRCWAMTRSCGFGRRRTGTSSTAAAASDANAGDAREARLEQAGCDPQGGERVAPLAPDEPIGLGGLVEWTVASGTSSVGVVGERRRGGREADGELERAGDPVAQATLGVDGQGGLAQRRPGEDDGGQQGQDTDDRDRGADDGRRLERDEARDGPQDELGDDDGREGDPRATDHAPQPQAPPMRGERSADARRATDPAARSGAARGSGGMTALPRRPTRPAGAGAERIGDPETGRSFGRPRRHPRRRGGGASDASGRRPGRTGAGR